MTVTLGGDGCARHVLTLRRTAGHFSARERVILRALIPFLATAVDQACRTGRTTTATGPPHQLTRREREVLGLVAEGLTDVQVARRLGVAPATVSKHLHRIYTRTEVPNRAAAVRLLTDPSCCPRHPETLGGR